MKERLLGAAVLVVAAILLIPALLDGPRPADQTVSQELVLPAPAADAEAAKNADAGADNATSGSLRTHTVDIEATEPGGARNPPSPVGDTPVTPPRARQQPASQEPAAPAAAPAETPAVTAPMPAKSWAVQVGSFTSESNARRLVEHLKGDQYPAYVVRNVVNGRVMFRVRVGPEPDRTRAEALARRLQGDRQQTQLVSHP